MTDAEAALLPDESLTEINDCLHLIQKRDGLTFGTDALLLSAFARPLPGGSAADFGSGSGVIAMLCGARKKFARIYALEIQEKYAEMIGRNVRLNGLEDRVEPVCGDVRAFRWEVDVVFTNPPYMKPGSGYASRDAGRDSARREKNGDIFDFCRAAAVCLKYGGAFYAVYRPDRLVDLLCAMRESKIEPKRMVLVSGDSRCAPGIVLVEGKRGAAPSLILPRVLMLRDDGGEMSREMRVIYETGNWYE